MLIDKINKSKLLVSVKLSAPLISTSEPTKSVLPFTDVDLLTDGGLKSDNGEDSDLDYLFSSAVSSEGPLMSEHIFSSFFNIVAAALLALQPDLTHTYKDSQ